MRFVHLTLFLVLTPILGVIGCTGEGATRPKPSMASKQNSPTRPGDLREGSGSIGPDKPRFLRHELRLVATWRMQPPLGERFDASGLLLLPDGRLLTVNDKGAQVCEILRASPTGGIALLKPFPAFTAAQLRSIGGINKPYFDGEALAQDEMGRLYLAEEMDRWILRWNPMKNEIERLPIDWAPVSKYFSKSDANASFEGLAVGGGKMFVANERQVGRIIVVDLETLKVVDDFQVSPFGIEARDVHYSDLCWYRDELWVLCRESRCVLRVDPVLKRVLEQLDYGRIELAPDNAYQSLIPAGFVEGLAVDADSIWLAVDNNGVPRRADSSDSRPTLFRCERPR